jgi:hypothetical protein
LVIEQVTVDVVEHHPCRAGAHEAIERLFKKSGGGGEKDLMGKVAADGAAVV